MGKSRYSFKSKITKCNYNKIRRLHCAVFWWQSYNWILDQQNYLYFVFVFTTLTKLWTIWLYNPVSNLILTWALCTFLTLLLVNPHKLWTLPTHKSTDTSSTIFTSFCLPMFFFFFFFFFFFHIIRTNQSQPSSRVSEPPASFLKQWNEDIPSRHMALIQRRLNVDATSWRCIDVEPTLYKYHVPTGVHINEKYL